MAQTVIEKIVQKHMIEGPDREVRAGDFVSLRPTHVLTHDNTAAVMKKFKAIGATRVADSRQPVFALDHDIQNKDDANLRKYAEIEQFAEMHGIDFYPAGSGIGHQIMVEKGYVVPGTLVVASDSHANMYGALGALGTPVVRTDAAGIWATGEFWWQVPRTVKVMLEGRLREGVSGKDVIITLCGLFNHDEVLNAVLEFDGEGVNSLSIDERLTIANMTTEWGALAAWFPPDEKTYAYLRRRRELLTSGAQHRLDEATLRDCESHPLKADLNAYYAAEISLDLSSVTPHVSGPDSVQVMHSVAELQEQKIAINKAYLVSCVNSRFEDLEAAARAIDGKTVASGVKFYVAAASAHEQAIAEAKGVWATLLSAGAEPLPASCGPCIGLGTGLLETGEVGISATNRNFKGRMGSRDAKCYLASPAVVAASAVAGYITAPFPTEGTTRHNIQVHPLPAIPAETVRIVDGFPSRVRGRLVFCPQNNLNTDGIYGKDYTYREDMTREMMAKVVMQNYDPHFAEHARAGDVLVGGFNFGTGSSREQAVTALQAKGIPVVIAGSFSQTYLRNAFNNGFLCIECPALVRNLLQTFEREIVWKSKTIVSGEEIDIDFSSCSIRFKEAVFQFPAMGSVPQSLVVAGGIEKLIASRISEPAKAEAVKA